jgi:GMP synthase (glutamine-hydrolysing)
MQKSALVIQHVAFEDLGSFASVLVEHGFTLDYVDAPVFDWDALDPLAHTLWVVLGGSIGVYEAGDYPFLAREVDSLRGRLGADLPTLGVCLGSQLIAAALGAAVYPSGIKEIGWAPLVNTAECVAALADMPVLHWHGDTFDLPAGARCLASTPQCQHQAFAKGRALGLQFHPEVTAIGLERWLVGHTLEISQTLGLSVTSLRADNQRYSAALAAGGARLLHEWLASL